MKGLAKRYRLNQGWILLEMTLSIFIVTALIYVLIAGLHGFSRMNAINAARINAVAAGQAQLDSLQIRGRELDPADLERLWPDITLVTDFRDGQGDWEGLTLVSVRVESRTQGKNARVALARYCNLGEKTP